MAGDAKLLKASLKGDHEAFGRIVRRYQSLICAIIYSGTGDLAASEDLAQETFLRAWQRLGSVREPGALRAWLCTIARNLATDHIRRRQCDPVAGAASLEQARAVESRLPGPDEEAAAREHERLVWDAVRQIPETCRVPLILYYRERHSVRRVAQTMGISRAAVKSRLMRARGMVRARLASVVDETLSTTAPGSTFAAAVLAGLGGAAANKGPGGGSVLSALSFTRVAAIGIVGVGLTVGAAVVLQPAASGLGQTRSTFDDVAEGVLSARSSLHSIRAAYTVSYSDLDKVRTVERDPEGYVHIHWQGVPAGAYTWAWSRDAEPSARNPYTSDKRLLETRQEEGDLPERRAWAFNGSVSTSLQVRERGHPNGWISPGVDFRAFVTNEVVSDFALYCYQETWETVIAHDWLRLAGTDTVDGRTCYVLEGRVSRNPDADFPGYPVKLWLDPGRGFACVKREVRDFATGDIVDGHSYKVLELKQVGTGLWMPAHVTYGNGADIRLTEVTVNEPIPEDVFTLSFPEGTVVTDKVLGMHYRINHEFAFLEGESAAPTLHQNAGSGNLPGGAATPGQRSCRRRQG